MGRLILYSKISKLAPKQCGLFKGLTSLVKKWCVVSHLFQKDLSLTTCDLRKSYMPRERQMFLLDCVARTISRQRDPPLPQLAALLPTFKNQSSVVLLDQSHCPRNLLVKPMGSLKQLTGLNGNARRKVTKRRHRWMRIATCRWKHRQMKIRSYRPYYVRFLVNWKEVGGGRRRMSEERMVLLLCLHQSSAIQGFLGFLRSFLLLQKAQVVNAGQRNALPTRAR